MIEVAKNWWNRPCGGRAVLAIAFPLIVSTASWTVMNFIDRMYLLWHSPQAMAAAMPAGMLHFSILCFPLGIASYVNTFVAQYEGAGRPDRIGLAIGQALRVGLVSTPILLATIPLAPFIFAWAGHAHNVLLEILVSMGFVGVFAFASLLIVSIAYLWRRGKAPPIRGSGLPIEGTAILLLLLVQGVISDSFGGAVGFEVAGLMLVVLIAAVGDRRAGTGPVRPKVCEVVIEPAPFNEGD